MINFAGNHGIKDSDLFDVIDLDAASKMVAQIDKAIRAIPDYPHEGQVYRDFTTLWNDRQAFNASIMAMYILGRNGVEDIIDKIVAIESRGWIYGAILADRMNLPLVVARKHKMLPAKTATQIYGGEDGDLVQIHRDAIHKGDNVLLIDDIIITGKSTLACARCVETLGGKVVRIVALADLDEKKGKTRLRGNGYKAVTALSYPGT